MLPLVEYLWFSAGWLLSSHRGNIGRSCCLGHFKGNYSNSLCVHVYKKVKSRIFGFINKFGLYKIIQKILLPLSQNKCCILAASLISRWSVLSPSWTRVSTTMLTCAVGIQHLFWDRGSTKLYIRTQWFYSMQVRH